jgi:hypothetical protein
MTPEETTALGLLQQQPPEHREHNEEWFSMSAARLARMMDIAGNACTREHAAELICDLEDSEHRIASIRRGLKRTWWFRCI